MCTRGNTFSRPVLIGRGLGLDTQLRGNNPPIARASRSSHVNAAPRPFRQGAQPVSGGYGGEVTPVPIPNTEVKLASADGTWG